jgi:hypothetical protein
MSPEFNTPAGERIELKTFEPSTSRASATDERNVNALINSDHDNEAMLRAAGRVVEAEALKASRNERVAEWRASVGLSAPAAPDKAVLKAADYGVHLNMTPGMYRGADLSNFALGKDPGRVENVKVELGEVMASLKVDASTGMFLMQHIAEESPKLGAMTSEGRANWAADQERMLATMARTRGTTARAMIDNAKAMLSGTTNIGKGLSDSALIYSPTIAATLWDHKLFIQAHKGAK